MHRVIWEYPQMDKTMGYIVGGMICNGIYSGTMEAKKIAWLWKSVVYDNKHQSKIDKIFGLWKNAKASMELPKDEKKLWVIMVVEKYLMVHIVAWWKQKKSYDCEKVQSMIKHNKVI